MTVTAHIDVNTPTGRRILKELETHKRVVKIEYPEMMEADGQPLKTNPIDEVYKQGLAKLSKHYGVDMDKLKS